MLFRTTPMLRPEDFVEATWEERKQAVHALLEHLMETNRDVLGPHTPNHDDDPATDMGEGTWVITGYVVVTEWKLMELDADAAGSPGVEYIRVFSSPHITDGHTAGLLHCALNEMR